MTKTKQEIILDSLINMYLKELSPVGSNQLKSEYELPFSSSTIRNYFKKLDEDGMIVRVHISSGSIPSISAMQEYWNEHLEFDKMRIESNFDFIESLSKEFGMFSLMKLTQNLVLNDVMDINKKFIVLEVENREIALKYDYELFGFLNQFKGYDLNSLIETFEKFGLNELNLKIDSINEYEFFNREFLYENYKNFEINDFLNAKIFNSLDEGISFNSNFLAYNKEILYNNKKAQFLCVGDVYSDYNTFFNTLIA
jgi:heat-inducible transcriptional repressor